MKKILFLQGIHHFGMKQSFVRDLERVTGMEVVTFPLFYSIFQTDRQLGLIQQVNEYLEANDGRFVVLGHSFGGLLAYSLSDASYKKIDRIITVASPHQVKFKWFRKVLEKLPYRTEVPVPVRDTHGFLFDTTVPYVFTRHASSQKHQIYLGTHNRIYWGEPFLKRLF